MNLPGKKIKLNWLIAGAVCCIIAIAALLTGFYISGDKTFLYKSSIPALMLIITMDQIRRNKRNTN